MSDKKDFYIGWQEKMPNTQKQFLKRIIIGLFILIPILGFVLVSLQQPFNEYQFEFGNVKEYTGTYFDTPIPMLIGDAKELPEGYSNSILLVGYGKFGAEGIIKSIETESAPLQGKKITIKGTLIYGDGKTLLELTEEEHSLVKIHADPIRPKVEISEKKPILLTGEILDPKCFFGVMKPGEGKIHKSCAIRCISGGIPPVFRFKNKNGAPTYYILRGSAGEKIAKDILPFVGEQISIKGAESEEHGWPVLYADVHSIARLN